METENWIGMSPVLPVVLAGMNPPAHSKSIFYHLMQNINETWGLMTQTSMLPPVRFLRIGVIFCGAAGFTVAWRAGLGAGFGSAFA